MENYEQLWECFLSDQMTVNQLQQHMDEDSDFLSFVERKIHESRSTQETGNL
jgi:hypothetical protein